MTYETPSQAEGERDDEDVVPGEQGRTMPVRTTPSQAEGERDTEGEQEEE